MPVLSRSLTLYVPVQHRRVALQAIDGFIAAAGGCTSRFVEGYWQGAGGRLVEDVNEITVFCATSQAHAVYAVAAKAAIALLSAGEEAVLIAEGKDTALYSAEDLPQLQQLVKDAQ